MDGGHGESLVRIRKASRFSETLKYVMNTQLKLFVEKRLWTCVTLLS